MGFWILMLGCVILFPLMMIIFGFVFCKKSPNEKNMCFGYRSPMSMKNKNTWDFAHKYFGKIWLFIGIIVFPLSIIAMFICLGNSEYYIGIYSLIILGVQTAVAIISIIITEKALKNRFDKNGNYK